jgi:hypothetical protein
MTGGIMSTGIKTMDDMTLAEEIVSVLDAQVVRVCSDDRDNLRYAIRGKMRLGEDRVPAARPPPQRRAAGRVRLPPAERHQPDARADCCPCRRLTCNLLVND